MSPIRLLHPALPRGDDAWPPSVPEARANPPDDEPLAAAEKVRRKLAELREMVRWRRDKELDAALRALEWALEDCQDE
jgi:hypothetical protein